MRIFFVLTMLATAACATELPKTDDDAARQTAAAVQQVPVDFNHPPRAYAVHEMSGWSVFVEQQLLDDEAATAKAALKRLQGNLEEVSKRLPKTSLPDLRRVKVFLLLGPKAKAGGRASGLDYFSPLAAESQAWLDPRMASSIVIFDAANYNQLSAFWSLKALVHEFGHAQHLEHWPEDKAEIYGAWKNAMKNGLYKTVREEDKDSFNPNYAAQNHLEYFAELTAAYFSGSNYYPRDRAALKAYDPAGYALIEKLWGCTPQP